MPTPKIQTRPLSELTIDESIDPRSTERSTERIAEYADNVENLPPILVDTEGRVIDGIHRYRAHELAAKDEIKVQVVNVDTRLKAITASVRSNALHGLGLTREELRESAIAMYVEGAKDDLIAKTIGRSAKTVHNYLKQAKAEWRSQARALVVELHDAGMTQKIIAKSVAENGNRGIDQSTVSAWLKEIEAEKNAPPEPEPDPEVEPEVEDAPDTPHTDEIEKRIAEKEVVEGAEESSPSPNPITPRGSLNNGKETRSAQRVDTGATASEFIEDEAEAEQEAIDELNGHEVGDLDVPSEEEIEAAIGEPDDSDGVPNMKRYRMGNQAYVYDVEDIGPLGDIHLSMVHAIGLYDEQIVAYYGDNVKAFADQKWEVVFVRRR